MNGMRQEPEMVNRFGFTLNGVKQEHHNKFGDGKNTASKDQSNQTKCENEARNETDNFDNENPV